MHVRMFYCNYPQFFKNILCPILGRIFGAEILLHLVRIRYFRIQEKMSLEKKLSELFLVITSKAQKNIVSFKNEAFLISILGIFNSYLGARK